MKKRLFSGLLAAVMLLTTAFAAGGDAASEQQTASGTVLTFAATLPEGTDVMSTEITEQLQSVLTQRLKQLALDNAAVAFPEDGKTVTVTLPDGAGPNPTDVAAFLSQTNALSATDANGKVWLTGADVTATEVGLTDDGSTAYIQLTLTTNAHQALLSELPADTALTVSLDGETVGQIDTVTAANEPVTVTGALTLDTAKLYGARIMAGTLPVALTLTEEVQPEQPEEPEQPTEPAFPDIAGHWAESALNKAVDMGLLKGTDGKMLPDDAVKRSEAVVMLNRALGATIADNTSGLSGTPSNAWYAADLGKAIHLGLIDANDSRNFDTAATRAEAFELLARAFVFDRAETGTDELSAFTDISTMTAAQQQAAAALVSAGVVNGVTDTTLAPQATLTRAQFVTMLTRVADEILAPQEETAAGNTDENADTNAETTPDTNADTDTEVTPDAEPAAPLTGGTILSVPEYTVSDMGLDGDLIFATAAQNVTLNAVTARDRIVLKGAENAKLNVQNGSRVSTLAIDPAGTADVSLSEDSSAGTLVIAGKGGAVNYSGTAGNIEITASGRTINLYELQADTVTITGSNNTIVTDGSIGAVAINGGAKNNKLTLNGTTDSLLVAGVGTTVDGKGKAATVDIRAVNCTVSIAADSMIENIDPGLSGVTLSMGVPTKVTAGGSLVTQVTFQGVTEPKICSAQWYKNGKPLANYSNDNFQLTADAASRITTYFTFTKDMDTSVTMGFKLTYENPSTGETEEKYIEKTVPIENYSDEWYYQRDVNRILNLVSSTYRGNYTTSYAINNDYATYEKEVWVNAKGYSSRTQYLVWINRAYQHVNVFQGSKGNWKLIKSFLVGTGAASSPTPTGLTTVSYKSAGGWTTSTYTVRPVVGFYPGTGYAFHSRLCYPGTDTEYDFSAGYPVSHGCVRMYKNDIKWIYNNIPVGTTVAIF